MKTIPARIKNDRTFTEAFATTRGLLKGASASSTLFKIHLGTHFETGAYLREGTNGTGPPPPRAEKVDEFCYNLLIFKLLYFFKLCTLII